MDERNPIVNAQMTVTNVLGTSVTITLMSVKDAVEVQRQLGARGWTCGEIPAGGYRLPYAAHDNFDWSLIGAVPTRDGDDEGVMCRGHLWKKRTFQEQTTGKKMGRAIKYSRGATPTDPPAIVEPSGDKGYVTLIKFAGTGKVDPSFRKQEPKPANGQPKK